MDDSIPWKESAGYVDDKAIRNGPSNGYVRRVCVTVWRALRENTTCGIRKPYSGLSIGSRMRVAEAAPCRAISNGYNRAAFRTVRIAYVVHYRHWQTMAVTDASA